MPYYALAFLAYLCYWLSKTAYSLYQNIQLARASGIPYIVSPIYGYNRIWLVTAPIWIRLAGYLPSFLTQPWIQVLEGDWSWKLSYTPFSPAMFDSDTFLIVAPERISMFTADAEVITQITTRKNDFPKPIEMYGSLDIFGKNVVSVEGGEWRRQRRLLTPQFNEKSNAVVWKETLFQAGEMLESWSRGSEAVADGVKSEKTGVLVGELGKDAMRLSLHVISRAGFDVRCLWPGAKPSKEAVDEGSMDSNVVPEGHRMSYTTSLETLLHYILAVLLIPDWLLNYSPWALLRNIRISYKEWGLYMDEIYDRKAETIQTTKSVSSEEGLDLMGAMIRHSGLIAGTPNHGKQGAGMSQSEIMGNSFVLFLAGHETAANSIHFCILFLAMRPDLQKKLQAELASIFGDTPPSTWSYDDHISTLFSTLTGAIMSEQLRLIPPVVMILKSTAKDSPQHLNINGKDCIVPGNTHISLDAVAVQRNKKYWPHGKPREGEAPIHPTSNLDNDLEEFKPERWFVGAEGIKTPSKTSHAAAAAEDNEFDIPSGSATTLFHPPRGSYIPFSEGPRSCIGRRFAQVEILATLAALFHNRSFELCTDEHATPEEVLGMSKAEREAVWGKAKREAERKIKEEMGTIITLQMRGEGVKLRVCKKGEELFC